MSKKPHKKVAPAESEQEAAPLGEASPESSQVNTPVQPTIPVTPETPAAPETVSLDAVLEAPPTMPEVQDHAVEAAREREAASGAVEAANAPGMPVKGQTDERGRAFDPAIHEVGPDGNGIVGKRTGYLRMRKGGASSGGRAAPVLKSKIAPAKVGAAPQPDAAAAAAAMQAKIDSTAAVTAELIFTAGQLVSDEFAPESGERENMTNAWRQYYTVRGCVDLPPEMLIAVALVGYVGKRWNAPKFVEKRRGWVAAWRGKKNEKQQEQAADAAIGTAT